MNKEMITGLVAAIVFLLVSVFSATYARAGCTAQKVGQFTYTNCDNGYSATEQQVGKFTYGQDNQGHDWTDQEVGNFTYRTEN